MICLKSYENLVVCEDCVLLHCVTCNENSLHRLECGIKDGIISKDVGGILYQYPLIRSILMAVDAFSNINNLMDFIEKTMIGNISHGTATSNGSSSKYRAFLKLEMEKKITTSHMSSFRSCYEIILNHPETAAIFNTKRYTDSFFYKIWTFLK